MSHASVRYASPMPAPETERDPDRYVTNNLTISAWAALSAAQAAARTAGLNPSKSAVLKALAAVARTHPDEFTTAIKDAK